MTLAAAPRAASAGMLAIAGLHMLWATGSTWPLADRAGLADAVAGRSAAAVPSPAACLAVAGLLSTGAALVAGHPRRPRGLARAGAGAVTAVFATRGALGLAGRTDLMSPGSSSDRFHALDRRVYGPLCLALAGLALPAAVSVRPRRG